MRLSSPNPHTLRQMLRVCLPGVACAGVLLAAVPSRGQDVAEAARQNRARKAQAQKTEKHVYTNEDLKRDHILTPADQARAEATKKNSPAAPANQEEHASEPKKNGAPESLGELARRYRQEKEAREAEEALKKQPASGYPMNVPEPEVAAPKSFVTPKTLASPRVRMAPRREARPPVMRDRSVNGARQNFAPDFSVPVSPAAPRTFPPDFAGTSRPFVPQRVSPFQPRPYVGPVIPKAPSGDLRVAPGAPAAPSSPMRAPRAAPALPSISAIHGKVRVIAVKPGDSWWKLSREFLGRGSRWQELLALNPGGENPDVLAAGREVLIPVTSVASPDEASTRITVHAKDTLWSIARAHFGSGKAWTCLASANPQIANPNVILPGQEIRAPESCRRKP